MVGLTTWTAGDDSNLWPTPLQILHLSCLRIEPWQCPALKLEIRPAITLTPKVASLLQAAQTALEVCAARERESFTTASEQQAEHLDRPLPGMLYQSQAMRALAARIHQIQGSDITLLLLGETGTGKELIAQAIHALSTRQAQPFLPFNCVTLSSALVESQLFGHRRGAFTGALQAKPGVIRAAEGGTMFLDEIGDLPLDIQPKLLRFLQNKEIHPLGTTQPVKVNVRLIAATHHSLEALLEQGKFREDLYHRLHVMLLFVPPLRERREEIPMLAQRNPASGRGTARRSDDSGRRFERAVAPHHRPAAQGAFSSTRCRDCGALPDRTCRRIGANRHSGSIGTSA